MIKVQLDFNSSSLSRVIKEAAILTEGQMRRNARSAVEKASDFLRDQIKEGYANYSGSLSDTTKTLRGGTGKPLYETGQLMRSVINKSEHTADEAKSRIFIKPGNHSPGVFGGRGGTYEQVAMVHEYGNPNNRLPNKSSGAVAPIPARPVWQPTWEKNKSKVMRIIEDELRKM